MVVVLVRGKELRKLVIIALLQVFTEGKHILYAHPTPHSAWAGIFGWILFAHYQPRPSPPLLPPRIVA